VRPPQTAPQQTRVVSGLKGKPWRLKRFDPTYVMRSVRRRENLANLKKKA
jgi:hypothetical protein